MVSSMLPGSQVVKLPNTMRTSLLVCPGMCLKKFRPQMRLMCYSSNIYFNVCAANSRVFWREGSPMHARSFKPRKVWIWRLGLPVREDWIAEVQLTLRQLTAKFCNFFGTLITGSQDAKLTDGILIEIFIHKPFQQLQQQNNQFTGHWWYLCIPTLRDDNRRVGLRSWSSIDFDMSTARNKCRIWNYLHFSSLIQLGLGTELLTIPSRMLGSLRSSLLRLALWMTSSTAACSEPSSSSFKASLGKKETKWLNYQSKVLKKYH